jgi:CRISPR-associated protein Cst2
MNKSGLTITYIVKAFPMNYDEGYGNVSVMKKVHRGSGDTLPFTSRQALRYSLTKWLFEHGFWKQGKLSKAQDVVQFDPEELKKYYFEEADLFGYMITTGKGAQATTRSAIARLTHLIGLDGYFGDQEFLSNKGFADRIKENPNIANIETSYNYYKYTLNIDLDLVGVDQNVGKNGINLPISEKIKRVQALVEATKYLYRDIRGRREDLKPLFVIGGVYPIKNPFFHNTVNVAWKAGRPNLSMQAIEQVLNITLNDKRVSDYTITGVQRYEFDNTDLKLSPYEALDKIREKVKDAYENS